MSSVLCVRAFLTEAIDTSVPVIVGSTEDSSGMSNSDSTQELKNIKIKPEK